MTAFAQDKGDGSPCSIREGRRNLVARGPARVRGRCARRRCQRDAGAERACLGRETRARPLPRSSPACPAWGTGGKPATTAIKSKRQTQYVRIKQFGPISQSQAPPDTNTGRKLEAFDVLPVKHEANGLDGMLGETDVVDADTEMMQGIQLAQSLPMKLELLVGCR